MPKSGIRPKTPRASQHVANCKLRKSEGKIQIRSLGRSDDRDYAPPYSQGYEVTLSASNALEITYMTTNNLERTTDLSEVLKIWSFANTYFVGSPREALRAKSQLLTQLLTELIDRD